MAKKIGIARERRYEGDGGEEVGREDMATGREEAYLR